MSSLGVVNTDRLLFANRVRLERRKQVMDIGSSGTIRPRRISYVTIGSSKVFGQLFP